MNDIYLDEVKDIQTYDHAFKDLNMWDHVIGDDWKQIADNTVGHMCAQIVRVNIPTFFTIPVFYRLAELSIEHDCPIDFLVNFYLNKYLTDEKGMTDPDNLTNNALSAILNHSKFIAKKHSDFCKGKECTDTKGDE